jgi:cytochrome c5
MKKVIALLSAVVIVAVAASVILMPSRASSSMKPGSPVASVTIPDTLMKVFQRACMDCHATDGNGMAKAHVNFSEWNNYSPDKQVEKAQAICKMLEKGSMPPKGWKKNNPDAVPTQKEVSAICNWAGSLNK